MFLGYLFRITFCCNTYCCAVFQLFGIRPRFTISLRHLIDNGRNSLSSSINENHDSSAPQVPHEIYKGMLTSQVRAVKSFSLGTSLIGIGMQPMLYEVSKYHINVIQKDFLKSRTTFKQFSNLIYSK